MLDGIELRFISIRTKSSHLGIRYIDAPQPLTGDGTTTMNGAAAIAAAAEKKAAKAARREARRAKRRAEVSLREHFVVG